MQIDPASGPDADRLDGATEPQVRQEGADADHAAEEVEALGLAVSGRMKCRDNLPRP